jgi:phage shock protein A
MEQNPLDPSSNLTEPSPSNTGTPQVDPDLLIDHLSYEETREYVWRFLLAEKITEKTLRQREQELEQWKQRVFLAQRAQDLTLIQEAQKRVNGLEQEIEKLKSEYTQLRDKNAILKEKLKQKTQQYAPSVDAHRLLAELEMLVNSQESQLNEKFENLVVEEEVEKLKSKLKES